MSKIARGLLSMGNRKLGPSIHTWSLEAQKTCPGSTPLCRTHCFAKRGKFLFKHVREKLAWNWEQAKRPDFVERMTREIRRKGVLACRIHPSGDFATVEYARKWLEVMRQSPRTKFWAYTRSYLIPEFSEILEKMAGLSNFKLWYSIDDDTGMPDLIPPGVRLAYMQVDTDRMENADLVFRIQRLRKEKPRFRLPMICPDETPRGRSRETNCGFCQHCFR